MTIDTCFGDAPPADHGPSDVRREVAVIADALSEVSARLDAVAGAEIGHGLAVMSLDQASQAVHLALLQLQTCLVPRPAAG